MGIGVKIKMGTACAGRYLYPLHCWQSSPTGGVFPFGSPKGSHCGKP